MIYSIPVQYTTTIHSRYPLKNTGGDPIAQLYAISNSGVMHNSRILLAPYVNDERYSNIDKVYLQCWIAAADLSYSGGLQLQLHELQQPWDSGFSLDTYNNSVYIDGATWAYAKKDISWTVPGGAFSEDVIDSQHRTYRNIYNKLQFDISSHTSSDYGFVLKLQNEDVNLGHAYLYSANTHTTFYPRYTACISDDSYIEPNTDSRIVQQTEIESYIYSIYDIQYSYNNDDIVRFDININPKTYSRDWTAENLWRLTNNITVTKSLNFSYAVYDVSQLQRIKIIDHSQYTKISCDGEVNYFMFDMNILQYSKYYQFELKIGNRYYLNDNIFKIA